MEKNNTAPGIFTEKTVRERLLELADSGYADFHRRLSPTLEENKVIGVRVPQLRTLARELVKENSYQDFLDELPHKYFDEDKLHAIILTQIKDYDRCLYEVERFLPYIEDWSVCDTVVPKAFGKNRDKLTEKVREWSASDMTYTCRFGINMLMSFYLEEDFKEEYLEIPEGIVSEDYYINMVIAWYFATALAKQWDAAIKILEKKSLGKWVHNKTIQKAIESRRITDEQKAYLRTLKL